MSTHENIGTPVQAIEFALKIDDYYDMREFLGSWNQGDLTDWPAFLEHINPKAVDPAWMVEVAREGVAQANFTIEGQRVTLFCQEVREGHRDDHIEVTAALSALRLALSRGHVVLAPVMPSEEEMLKRAREDVQQIYKKMAHSAYILEDIGRGSRDACYEVQCALQARRNIYASLGAVKAVSSGPVVPEVDVREALTKAFNAGHDRADAKIKGIAREAFATGFEEDRTQAVSAILENLKSREV